MATYPPPQTFRPPLPLVAVLERDASGLGFLQRMREVLDPGEWAVSEPTGFWWVPHRTVHRLELVELPDAWGTPGVVVRSQFTLVEQVSDPVNALGMCAYLNQRSFGGAVWFDLERRSIHVTTCARLSPALWFDAEVFELTVPRLVGICERLAPRLAAEVGGVLPEADHPSLGPRLEPDQLVHDVQVLGALPEAATGVWWSHNEVRGMRAAVRHVLGERGAEPDAAMLGPDDYDPSNTSAQNIDIDVRVPSALGPSWLTAGESVHPDFGRVFEVLQVSPVRFEGSDDGPPVSDLGGMLAANALNALSVQYCPHRLLLAGLTVWRGQLCRSTVLLPEVVRIVQNVSLTRAGEVFGMLVAAMLEQHDFVVEMLERFDDGDDEHDAVAPEGLRSSGSILAAPWRSIDRALWAGVAENAGHHSLLADDRALFGSLPELPVNELCAPIVFDHDGSDRDRAMWLVQRSALVAQWGIFNPIGPTVCSFEVAIDYVGGRGYLFERLCHPFGPRLTLHAVIDVDGFADLGRLLEQLVGGWGDGTDGIRSLPDWFEVVTPMPGVGDALYRGLLRFAAASDTDLVTETVAASASVVSPWARFTAADDYPDDVAELRALEPDELVGEWLSTISNAMVIDAHVAHLRSAWEGAAAFVRDPDRAQHVADQCRQEIARRIEGQP